MSIFYRDSGTDYDAVARPGSYGEAGSNVRMRGVKTEPDRQVAV